MLLFLLSREMQNVGGGLVPISNIEEVMLIKASLTPYCYGSSRETKSKIKLADDCSQMVVLNC